MPGLREQLIVELDRARHGFGETGPAAVTVRSPVCGDEISVALDREGDVIRSLTWRGHGCTVSMASASALAALVDGMSVASFAAAFDGFTAMVSGPTPGDHELESHDNRLGDAIALAGIGRLPLRGGCATLAWRAVRQAIDSAPPR